MHILKYLTPFVLVVSILFPGCKKDKGPDVRDVVTGTYTGSQTYTLQWSKISSKFADSTVTYSVALTVAIDNSTSDGLAITELGLGGYPNFPYKATAVIATNDGAMFNIPQQTVTTTYFSSISNTTITGSPCFLFNNASYDGHYTDLDGLLSLVYGGTTPVFSSVLGQKNVPFVIINTCTKQ